MSTKSPELLDSLRRALLLGMTVGEAATMLGISKKAAEGLVRRHIKAASHQKRKQRVKVKSPPICRVPMATKGEGAPLPGCCQWPLSNGRPWVFCTAPRVPDRPYCEAHMQRAFIRGYKPVERGAFILNRLGSSL